MEVGDLGLIIQIVIFFILILGLPLTKSAPKETKNLVRHGYLTIFALILHTIIVIVAMILFSLDGYSELLSSPPLSLAATLTHIILGVAALVLGYVVVSFWISKPLNELRCYRAKKLMLPLIVIWGLSLVIGAIVHLVGFF